MEQEPNTADGVRGTEIVPYSPPTNKVPKRVWESVTAYTVQCASCSKWRLIPSKEKYEEIRERIMERPFYCETAREWRPDISCDNESDVTQNGTRVWAMDRPNIPQPPPNWQRILRVRAEGGKRFADVYYVSPSNKRMRSRIQVQKYLDQHPEYQAQGVNLSQFSFQIPAPLDKNYVGKRVASSPRSPDTSSSELSG